MAVRKSKASSPDHLNKLVAGTLKDEVKKREIKKRKEMNFYIIAKINFAI